MRIHKRNRPLVLAGIVSGPAFGLGLMLAVPSALPAADDTLDMSYIVYVSGARVYKVNFTAILTSDSYATRLSMGPKGLGKVFSNYELDMTASGTIAEASLEPRSFNLKATEDGKEKTLEMSWQASGRPETERSFEIPGDRMADVAAALEADTPDPLTAALSHGFASPTQPCSGTERAYNGTEVYDLQFALLGKDVIRGKMADAFKGQALKCEVTFAPVAGYSDKKMKKYTEKPPAYTVWFAEIATPTTGHHLFIPVGAQGTAAGRKFLAIASKATLGGEPLSPQVVTGN